MRSVSAALRYTARRRHRRHDPISYAADPALRGGGWKELLCVLGSAAGREPELIACPTCGRIEIDLIASVAQVRQKLADIKTPVKVAVMGCVVNGPGEAEGADVAVFAGKGRASSTCRACRRGRGRGGDARRVVAEESLAFAERVEWRETLSSGLSQPPCPTPCRADGSIAAAGPQGVTPRR
ncbi:MAG: flavodoxin-dependent (E)-4-hydroxy-3-methylbut-2-enyl-diphosphate synthase [Phycisphaerales bacterium]|nr:flavodoxin-dependent (E)-4-hydroxy-3-methylbut-2-enyl-diphosphate synthase [Phycisphaerales bacterium]